MYVHWNRPFPSSLVPLFQSESSAKPFLWKWLWFAWEWNCMQSSFSYERFRTQTRFEREAQENSEMAYCHFMTYKVWRWTSPCAENRWTSYFVLLYIFIVKLLVKIMPKITLQFGNVLVQMPGGSPGSTPQDGRWYITAVEKHNENQNKIEF